MPRRLVASAATALVTLGALTALPAPVAQAADSNCPAAAGSYAGGSGTVGDPFLISAPGELQRLRDRAADWNKVVRLTTDIDMSSAGTACTWTSTIGNPNVANWTGTFDGDGHVVSGLNISITGSFAGFIAYLGNGAVVRDLGFTGNVNATVTSFGSAQVGAGGLVGWTLPSTIQRSFATGNVTVNITAAAGLFSGGASANPIVGGLVGTSQGTVSNSYATGDISVTATAAAMSPGTASVNAQVGGLLGSAEAGSSVVVNSYSTGAMTISASAVGGTGQVVNENVGGSIGRFSTQYASATSVVWDTVASARATGIGNGTSAGVTGKTTSEMTTLSTFTNLNWDIVNGYDANRVWNLCPALNDGAPVLSRFASNGTCSPPPPSPPPPPPVPASEPRAVTATALAAAARVVWDAPSASGSFPITQYLVESSPGRHICLAAVTSCEVSGLTPGTAYTFTVRALNGAGWSVASAPSNVVVPIALPRPEPVTLVITGTRAKGTLTIKGTSTGLEMGAMVTPWARPMRGELQQGRQVPVSTDGMFTWSRRVSTEKPWSVFVTASGTRSNLLVLP